MPQYYSLISRGAFAPWDEKENRPQVASNSSASDRQSHRLFAPDPPPLQRGFYRPPFFSAGEDRMPSFFPFNADEMNPKQPSFRHYSHVAQFPISSQTLHRDPRIEARTLSGVNHNYFDPDIHFRSPIPCTLPSPLTVSNDYVNPTRYLRVSNVPRNISKWDARDAFMSFGDLRGVFSAYLESDGKLFLEFFDIRHTMNAAARLASHPVFSSSSIKVEYCSKATMSKASNRAYLFIW